MCDVEDSSNLEQVCGGDKFVLRRSECMYNQRLSTVVRTPFRQQELCRVHTLYKLYEC